MAAIVLALLSALCYGTSDFVGGILAGRWAPWTVALWGQIAAGVVVAAVALPLGGDPSSADLLWAVLAGVGSGFGCAFLYRGFTIGRMGVVAPISGVGTGVVPVVAGLLGGERPALPVWLGIVIAMPAIWLVAREPENDPVDTMLAPAGGPATGGSTSRGVFEGVVAGLGFGLSFAAIGQVPDGAGLWPVALNFLIATITIGIGALLAGEPLLLRGRGVWLATLPGLLGALALVVFMLSAQLGYLTVTGVISALYPAATVLLAATVLREHIHRGQAVGLGLCGVAVALVATG